MRTVFTKSSICGFQKLFKEQNVSMYLDSLENVSTLIDLDCALKKDSQGL